MCCCLYNSKKDLNQASSLYGPDGLPSERYRLIFSCSIHLYADSYCAVGSHCCAHMEGASCKLVYIINLLTKPFQVKFE